MGSQASIEIKPLGGSVVGTYPGQLCRFNWVISWRMIGPRLAEPYHKACRLSKEIHLNYFINLKNTNRNNSITTFSDRNTPGTSLPTPENELGNSNLPHKRKNSKVQRQILDQFLLQVWYHSRSNSS